MVAITDVQGTCGKGDSSVSKRTHHDCTGTTTGHHVYFGKVLRVALLIGFLATGWKDAQMFGSAKNTYLHVDAVDATEQTGFEYFGGTTVGDDAALEEQQAGKV